MISRNHALGTDEALLPGAARLNCGLLRARHGSRGDVVSAPASGSSPGHGKGLLYGLALFLVDDELLNALLGLSAGPTEYPWQAHARGLVSHLVVGVCTDVAMDALDVLATSLWTPWPWDSSGLYSAAEHHGT